ncbi:MAG: 50S ribosomal protein L1 [Candidatus Komeilibacteria bacterium CG_4_10_14_0_2_um_filter_37_10]|uniref:Large ribosomal subunit protein uL1 n=1 Tax=Candidatus Komeilibacteria bacterium CG_4_10_14_0_2_um_filter_37_10 TaxID=1974470 RepID=A0A2M7VE18_9BACT|nr:MAG: 50S ribosomal protein L1 [Candidatus Komeilibacteria bacterium CG_4_10_14_0_2_um_filter_37_10]
MSSKRIKNAISKIDSTKKYSIAEAVKLVKETGQLKFDASMELHINLNIDVKKSDQQVRGSLKLPNGTGKTRKVAAFVGPDKVKDAKEAGAYLVGGEELIEQIKKGGKIDFEVAVATPDMMPKMAVIAKTLGQKGLMPNPKSGTITTDIRRVVTDLNTGLVSFKNDAGGGLHCGVGKLSFADEKLEENVKTFIDEVKKMKPDGVKGTFIKSAYVTSTMGPSIALAF